MKVGHYLTNKMHTNNVFTPQKHAIFSFFPERVIFIFVICFTFLLRISYIDLFPPALNPDEVSTAYNAFSLLKTGKDEYGIKLPMVLRSFDDFRPPVMAYTTVASEAIFGINDFSVRLPSAFFGTLGVIFLYFLVRSILAPSVSFVSKEKVATLAAFLLGVSPWHLFFSRFSLETNLGTTFILAMILYLWRGLLCRNLRNYIIAFMFLLLAMNTYHSFKIIAPLAGILTVALHYKNFSFLAKWKKIVVALILFLVILPTIYSSIFLQGLQRGASLSIFGDFSSIAQLSHGRSLLDQTTYGSYIGKFMALLDNSRILAIYYFVWSYLSYVSLGFLVSPLSQPILYRIPNIGLLFAYELVLLPLGLVCLIQKKMPKKSSALLLLLLAITPLPAAIISPVSFSPTPTRVTLWNPSFVILEAFGFLSIRKSLQDAQKKTLTTMVTLLFSLAVTISLLLFFHSLFLLLPNEQQLVWSQHLKEIFKVTQKIEPHQQIYIDATIPSIPYINFLWLTKFDPDVYLASGGTKNGSIFGSDSIIGNYHFIKDFRAYLQVQPIDPSGLYIGKIQDFSLNENKRKPAESNTLCWENKSYCLSLFKGEELVSK